MPDLDWNERFLEAANAVGCVGFHAYSLPVDARNGRPGQRFVRADFGGYPTVRGLVVDAALEPESVLARMVS